MQLETVLKKANPSQGGGAKLRVLNERDGRAARAYLAARFFIMRRWDMQVTLYFSEEDRYLIELVDEVARKERKSRSAVVLSILEQHFERDKRLGEILVDLRAISPREVEMALELQRKDGDGKRLGELLVEHGFVPPEEIERALLIQGRVRR